MMVINEIGTADFEMIKSCQKPANSVILISYVNLPGRISETTCPEKKRARYGICRVFVFFFAMQWGFKPCMSRPIP